MEALSLKAHYDIDWGILKNNNLIILLYILKDPLDPADPLPWIHKIGPSDVNLNVLGESTQSSYHWRLLKRHQHNHRKFDNLHNLRHFPLKLLSATKQGER